MKKIMLSFFLATASISAYAHKYIIVHTVNFSLNDVVMTTQSNKQGLTIIDVGCIDSPTPCQHDPMTLERVSPRIGATASIAMTLPSDTKHTGKLEFYWTHFADGTKYDVSKQVINVTGYQVTMSPEPCGAGDCDITVTKK